MKLARLSHNPAQLIAFFGDGLHALGAVCEQTWHDRLHILAEGPAAALWNRREKLLEAEIRFTPAGDASSKDADKEIFPGCPLTIRLCEALRAPGVKVQRVCIEPAVRGGIPMPDTAEKLWRSQWPGTIRWRLIGPFAPSWHFSLLALVRCEIRAIDQSWSLHRVALSLPDGARDEVLARDLDFFSVVARSNRTVDWPVMDIAALQERLRDALWDELKDDLGGLRKRQEKYLARELDRVDQYFADYRRELAERMNRRIQEEGKRRLLDRMQATRIEHERRRQDQVQRHEINIVPHFEALVLLAEPAWRTTLHVAQRAGSHTEEACFVPRSRRWVSLRVCSAG